MGWTRGTVLENEKKLVCPVSGVGKPIGDWEACTFSCGLYDAAAGRCALAALWNLRFLDNAAQALKEINELGLNTYEQN